MIGDILQRAEPSFRRDKKETQDHRRREMMGPLVQQLAALEERLESDDSPECMNEYERLLCQLDELKHKQIAEDIALLKQSVRLHS
ncbi:MAG TPA: hypothetical protein VJB64_00090 [Patescibacteria group bacterium]|nr:hypothetical protein [Patescibacteria group bacterium]